MEPTISLPSGDIYNVISDIKIIYRKGSNFLQGDFGYWRHGWCIIKQANIGPPQ